jgi:hypothetical protein
VEERKFLYTLCSRILEIDKSIKFTSVINSAGKLIVGKSKHCIIKKNVDRANSFFWPKQSPISDAFPNDNNGVYSIMNKNNILHNNPVLKHDFYVINVNNDVCIAFICLTESQDKYLCIYFESHNPMYDVLLKLNTIFECIG